MENDLKRIYPGTVFISKHYDQFTSKFRTHPFVCIYNQALDQNIDVEGNIVGLMITSNNKQADCQVSIPKDKNQFLEKDSFCYCNNLYTFLNNDKINIIGTLDSETFFQIVKKRQQLLRAEQDQCIQSLMNMKSFESKKKIESKVEQQKKQAKNKKGINKSPKIDLSKKIIINTATEINNSPKKFRPKQEKNLSLIENHKETQEEKLARENFHFEGDDNTKNILDKIEIKKPRFNFLRKNKAKKVQ